MSEKIVSLHLDEGSGLNLPEMMRDERDRAIDDLLRDNQFVLKGEGVHKGSYHVALRAVDKRLVVEVCQEDKTHCCDASVLLLSFRGLMKDYQMVCDNYYKAVKEASAHKIEALDMGRRGLHNEGAEMLQGQLEELVECDFDTARRLFTLMYILFLPSLR